MPNKTGEGEAPEPQHVRPTARQVTVGAGVSSISNLALEKTISDQEASVSHSRKEIGQGGGRVGKAQVVPLGHLSSNVFHSC